MDGLTKEIGDYVCVNLPPQDPPLTNDVVHGTGVTRLAVPHPVAGDHVELDHSTGHEVVHSAGQLVAGPRARQSPAAVILCLADCVL